MNLRHIMLYMLLMMSYPALAEPAATDLARLEGGSFVLDRSHARLLFSFNHFGFSTSYGLFPGLEATLQFDPKAPAAGKLEATVDLSSVDTTVAKLDEHMKAATFFDVAKYPKATFKSTKITVTGPTTGVITGDLTLHGVTRPVTLDATFNGGGTSPATKAYVLGFNATGHIMRSEFGLNLYVPMVGDDVLLTISTEFDRVP